MIVAPRKRFLSGDEIQLPLTNTAPLDGSSNSWNGSTCRSRLVPGRSLSSSAALLKQRHARLSNSPISNPKPQRNPEVDGFLKTPYGWEYTGNYRSTATDWKTILLTVLVIAFVLLCFVEVSLYEQNRDLEHTLFLREQEIDHHLDHADSLERKVNKLKSVNLKLHRQVETLEELPAVGMTELQRRVFQMEHTQHLMEQGIQLSSRRLVREKFGPGPYYYIEIQLQFPDHQDKDTILLQTAHLDSMPHSIHLFLEQVSHGLYDNTAFHRRTSNRVQAGPSNDPKAHEVFRQHPSLNSVLFQEYNPIYPHYQYTLGYTGRPGGPDLTINLKDSSNAYKEEPCFAQVVVGTQVLEQLQQERVGWEDVLVHPVKIHRMRIISQGDFQQRVEESHARMQ